MIAIVCLILFSESGLKNTFYSPLTCRGFQTKLFRRGDDRTKLKVIISTHKSILREIESEVKDWLLEVWDELHHTKPSWFTEDAIRRIPLEFIPNIESVKEGMDEGGWEEEGELRVETTRNMIGRAYRLILGVDEIEGLKLEVND